MPTLRILVPRMTPPLPPIDAQRRMWPDELQGRKRGRAVAIGTDLGAATERILLRRPFGRALESTACERGQATSNSGFRSAILTMARVSTVAEPATNGAAMAMMRAAGGSGPAAPVAGRAAPAPQRGARFRARVDRPHRAGFVAPRSKTKAPPNPRAAPSGQAAHRRGPRATPLSSLVQKYLGGVAALLRRGQRPLSPAFALRGDGSAARPRSARAAAQNIGA